MKDKEILQQARYFAKKVLRADPSLKNTENAVILITYEQLAKHKDIWNYIS